MAKAVGLQIDGLQELKKQFTDAATFVPRAIKYALGQAADEIRDTAHTNVGGSSYKLAQDVWGIKSRMSRKIPFTSEVGYFTDKSNWHIKFYESGATRKDRGAIIGGHFLKSAGSNAETLAENQINESIAYILQKYGLS